MDWVRVCLYMTNEETMSSKYCIYYTEQMFIIVIHLFLVVYTNIFGQHLRPEILLLEY